MSTSNHTSDIPYGYCQCGCGQKTNINTRNDKAKGLVKGEPRRFAFHHNGKEQYLHALDRFWASVNKNGTIQQHCPELGQCWEWTGYKEGGYGVYNLGKKKQLAHRVSWGIAYNSSPGKLHVLHKCDNPSCVNPAHLFLGTQQDNVDDMNAKHRNVVAKGEQQGHHKVTEKQVREIRERFARGGITKKELARIYGISRSTTCSIINRKSWRHIA